MKIHTSNLGPDFEKVVRDAIHAIQPVADSGVAVAVIQKGQLAYAGGFGFRDRAASAPVDADTLFAIGSATKAFTSMAVMMHVEAGQLSLDTPVRQYLPDFKMKDPRATREMTLKDILSHRTGLPRHDALWYIGPFSRSQLLYRLRYLQPFPRLQGQPPSFRNLFLYNNIMYMVAGHLLEILFGVSYESIIKTRILDPLGMTATSFSLASLTGAGNYAKGYEKATELPLKDFANVGPAGEINSSVLDMAKWIELFLRKGLASKGAPLISSTLLTQMYTPLSNPGDGSTYGLGWNICKVQVAGQNATPDKLLVFHTGDADGNSAYVSFMPNDGLGVVVLTNQQCTDDLIDIWPDRIAAAIYGNLLGGALTGLPTPVASPAPPALPAGPELDSPDDYTGIFSNPGYGDLVVNRAGDDLAISYYGLTWPLEPVKGDDFQFHVHGFGTIFPVFVIFKRHSRGAIQSLTATLVRPPIPAVSFVKRGASASSTT
jgi:CubicO group peptidase (beta-lactamase class C family)